MPYYDDKQGKKPFVIPPPTLDELGIVPFKEKPWPVKLFRSLALAVFIAGVSGSVGAYIWLRDLGIFNIDKELLLSVQTAAVKDNSSVFDRNGVKIGEYFDHYHIFVPYKDLPKDLINAIVAVEDKNFFTHHGVDPKAMLRAVKALFKNRSIKQGASTITQQIVRHHLLTREKSLARKVQELFLAYQLEQTTSKERIMELYTNKLFLGNGAYGVGAAAQRYFGKRLNELQPQEMALIAGLFQSPSQYNPHKYPERAKRRQRQVLGAMYQAGMITKSRALELIEAPLNYVPYKSMNDIFAGYFLDYVREEVGKITSRKIENYGLKIYTTLDTSLQQLANETFQNSKDVFDRADSMIVTKQKFFGVQPPSVEAAQLTMDPQTGEILTMVGGRDYIQSKFNRAVKALRSPGSAFKPVVYSLALQRGWKWSDVLFVSPVSINGYRPKNYSDNFLTETTMLRAFYQSLNTATVELGAKIGVEEIVNYTKTFGIESEVKNEPGIMLGSSEVTMLDLAKVYQTFANRGKAVKPVVIREITDHEGNIIYKAPSPEERSQTVVSEQVAYLMTEGLRSVMTHGTAHSAGSMANFAVGKTGTSNNSEDNWFAGYSTNLLNLVWVGTDDHLPLSKLAAGNTLALPIWQRFMEKALAMQPGKSFPRPTGIVGASIHPMYGNRSAQGIPMFFLESNQPKGGTSDFQTIGEEGGFRTLFSH